MTTSAASRYDNTAIALHWLIALLLLGVATIGLLFDDLKGDVKAYWLNIHAAVGVTIIALVILRLVWRISHKPPALTPAQSIFHLASSAAHWGLYLLMLLVPVGGSFALFYRGRGINFGLFSLASPFVRDPTISRPITELHGLFAYGLFALAGIHILAALYHQYGRKDGLLLRMMPGK